VKPEPNASLAVEMPNGEVLMSVFISRTDPHQVSPVLLHHYSSHDAATELVIRGDFEDLRDQKRLCKHFCESPENDAIDCLPEVFESYYEYESAMVQCSYGFNYVFRNQWLVLESVHGGPVYTPVEKYVKEPHGKGS